MFLISRKPGMGKLMMHMCRVHQRDQNVDIQESDAHSSSRNLLTSAKSGRTDEVVGRRIRCGFV